MKLRRPKIGERHVRLRELDAEQRGLGMFATYAFVAQSSQRLLWPLLA
jgi:hypothetical protein